MSTAYKANGHVARYTIARRRKNYVPLQEQAEKAFAIALGLLAEGKAVTKAELSRRLGYKAISGNATKRLFDRLTEQGRWPVTEAMLPTRKPEPPAPVAPAYKPADEPFVPPPAETDVLATLYQIRERLDTLPMAARQLVKSWL